ncbi:WD repeat and FYVE domain-containing protein 3-like isoform X2 [Xenia sp. Carnegie-2017]|nr:WD repeat and FYVE domain-containing protein 3-like isoform X2 [Xenia sp. Carnegie-2017]
MNPRGAKGIVRLLWGRRSPNDDTSSSSLTGDAGLSLMHLRKLFMEFIHSSVPLTLKEQEKKLYAMLPVFNNVFMNSEGSDMSERFGDVLQFAAHTSRLMVNEIRRHAVNKSNNNASTAIMNFLIKKADTNTQSGWNLLQSLSILANGQSAVISDMIATQLPSTLVHCLYLFFELPKPCANTSIDASVLEESYLTVQKLFIQLLVRLCNQSITAQELVRTDDLFILFTAMSGKCLPHNTGWRTGICEVLTTITRSGLQLDVCKYIHAKSCISHCISSMRRIQTENPLDLVEMFVTLFCILRDSTTITSILMDDFRSCHGYLFLKDYLLLLGQIDDHSAADACRNMVICVSNFTMVGFIPLRPSRSIGAPFQDSDFQIPEAAENGNTVRNVEAFNVLQSVFIKSKDSLLCQHVLDSILRIYTSDHVNYFILEPQRTISNFIEKVNEKEVLIQEKVFKLLEFVACNLNWTPSPELISMSILFKNANVNTSWIFALECLIQLVNYKDQYKNVFRDVGLLEVLSNCLVHYALALKSSTDVADDNHSVAKNAMKILMNERKSIPKENDVTKLEDYPMLLMECLRIMIEKCSDNSVMFRKCGGASCVHSLVQYESARTQALKIIQVLILNQGHDDLRNLLRSLRESTASSVSMKVHQLHTVIQVFALEPTIRTMFRDVGGYIYVMSVLMSMEGSLHPNPSANWKDVKKSDILEMLRFVLYVFTSAMQDEPANKTFFIDKVGHKGLVDNLRLLGCFDINYTTLTTDRSVSPNGMKTRLKRTQSSRSSIYVDPKVPCFHPDSSLFAALHVFHCLLDMAMDSFTLKLNTSITDDTDSARVYPLDVSCICHPVAVTVLVELLPSIVETEQDLLLHQNGDYQDALDLQLYVANKVQSCLRSERNQQVMCQAGLPQQMLLHCQAALEIEEHPLHLPLQRIFERLATQALTPVVLRDFLRLANPLECAEVEITQVTKRGEHPRVNAVDGVDNKNNANGVNKTVLQQSTNVHKQSLLKDFHETLYFSGACLSESRSRASSTNSSLSGGEDANDGIQDRSLSFLIPRQSRRRKSKNKSQSKFYTPSPSSSLDELNNVHGSCSSPADSTVSPEPNINTLTIDSSTSGLSAGDSVQSPVNVANIVTSCTVDDATNVDKNDDKLRSCEMNTASTTFLPKTASNIDESSSHCVINQQPSTCELSTEIETKLCNGEILDNHLPDTVLSNDDTLSSNELNDTTSNTSLVENKTSEHITLDDSKQGNSVIEIATRQGGGPVSLSRIKCLVSTTTPRDMHLCGTTTLPSFVEFNMSLDGFGCLYFPSITPHASPETAFANYMAGVSSAVMGSVPSSTAGDRTFPPQAGMTFLAWFCVERFSSPLQDPHPIRLLAICFRSKMINGTYNEETCLNIRISASDIDRSLVISTEEEFSNVLKEEDRRKTRKKKSRNEARFPLSDRLQEGYWHHVTATLKPSLMSRHCTAAVYLDGSSVGQAKIRYIPNVSLSVGTYTASTTDAYIGTRRSQRRCSKLIWQLGPCYLMEEPLLPMEISCIHKLGPSYSGSFQAPIVKKNNHSGDRDVLEPLVNEANIVFGINAHATSRVTINKLKKHFSKSESRAVALKLGLSKKDNSTPFRLFHNTASHLQGPSRCLGGVIVGISGVRTFVPRPVAELISYVGGTTTLLGLVAMANDVEMLYAAVKALCCVLKYSFSAREDMERIKGYQILALLFKRKQFLLNTHILHLTFALVGTVDSEREMATIPNEIAFKDLLCDFEVWTKAPENLQKSLLSHFLELLSQSSQLPSNISLMQDLGIVSKLLFVLKDESIPISTINVTCDVITAVLRHGNEKRNICFILQFGQFLTWTLLPSDENETEINMSLHETDLVASDGKIQSVEQRQAKRILLRNHLLEIFLTLVGADKKSNAHERFSDAIHDILGFDWILLFMKDNTHSSTVVRALRLLVTIISSSDALEKFREGSSNGGWLKGTEALKIRLVHVVGGFNVKAKANEEDVCEVNRNAVNVPGFVTLNQLLSKHVSVPEIYHLLISLLLKHPVADVKAGIQFDWNNLYHVFWVTSNSMSSTSPPPSPHGPEKRSIYCPEAACVLLSMARMVCGKEWQNNGEPSWLEEYPVTVVQFLQFLFYNVEHFSLISSSQDFIEHLVAVVFPEIKMVRISSTKDDSSLDILSMSRGTVVLCNEAKETLIKHPAKKLVMDFLRVLITDALTTPPYATTLIDTILESVPPSSKIHQTQEFQTEVLNSQMDYLLAGNLLSNPGKVLTCICNFVAKIVDKLWQEYFILGYKPIFNFVITIIESSRGHSIAKDGAFHSLNRVILFQLSRALKEKSDFSDMLEFLHTLTINQRIVFSSINNNADFIASLCYHLLILTGAILPEHSNNIELTDPDTITGPNDLSHSSALLTAAAERVWEIFIQNKKDTIENVFKFEFPKSTFVLYNYGIGGMTNVPDKSFKTMNLDPKSLGPKLLEPAKKIWDAFIVSEIKHKGESPKPQKPLRNRRTVGRKEKVVDSPLKDNTDVFTNQHIDLVKKLFLHQNRNFHQNCRFIERSLDQKWASREYDLTRVRGLWGPPTDSRLNKWMLDMVEGPYRMRKKMCKNDSFYDNYCFNVESGQSGRPTKFKVPMSSDSRLYAMLSDQKIRALEMKKGNKYERSFSEYQPSSEFSEVEMNENNDMEDQTILKLLDAGEKIRSMFRCARVEGLDHAEGLFLFGQSHFYVVDGVTLLSTKEIKDIESLPADAHDPIIPRSSHDSGNLTFKKLCSTWAYEAVREVQKRRYILQDTALEVFSNDGRNHLLVFPKSVRDKVYNKMLSMIPTSPVDSVSGQKPDTEVEALGIINAFMGERSVTQRWEKGEISNFQYLMYLNTISGRSYNDLMQYPVFPWIIADYDSEELDLYNPATFRDLSKPMGAQTEGRKKDFEKRYREWDDPSGETPAYHYATHYSSAMVVASYLVRMEPFTQHFLRLQGGHFDLPDRMFHGMKDAWMSASETNMADVKELIPEFFYLPEFLVNDNRFDLGQKQNGVILGDVLLPPWAKGDPREFIRQHRKALECDYVSSRLHLWIDLIFGYKQRGDAAKEAVNVFHHWFYADSADITNINDPVKRNAKIGFINNFGQTPKQLFKKPHVSKKAFLVQDQEQSGSSFVVHTDKVFNNFTKMMPSTQPIKEINGPVGEIIQTDKGINALKKNYAIFPHPSNQYASWGFGDLSLRIGLLDGDKVIAVMEDCQVGQILCAACPDSRTLITGGKNT